MTSEKKNLESFRQALIKLAETKSEVKLADKFRKLDISQLRFLWKIMP